MSLDEQRDRSAGRTPRSHTAVDWDAAAIGWVVAIALLVASAVTACAGRESRTRVPRKPARRLRGQAQSLAYFDIEADDQYPVGAVTFTNTTVRSAAPTRCRVWQAGSVPRRPPAVTNGVMSDGGRTSSGTRRLNRRRRTQPPGPTSAFVRPRGASLSIPRERPAASASSCAVTSHVKVLKGSSTTGPRLVTPSIGESPIA